MILIRLPLPGFLVLVALRLTLRLTRAVVAVAARAVLATVKFAGRSAMSAWALHTT